MLLEITVLLLLSFRSEKNKKSYYLSYKCRKSTCRLLFDLLFSKVPSTKCGIHGMFLCRELLGKVCYLFISSRVAHQIRAPAIVGFRVMRSLHWSLRSSLTFPESSIEEAVITFMKAAVKACSVIMAWDQQVVKYK